jgi:N-acetylneuraminic acid mutarotase
VKDKIRSASASLLFFVCLVTLTSAFNLPNTSRDLSSQLASLRTAAKPAQQRTTLTLADRVIYQRAIEEVYWRHRIWPKERPDPKPSLDQVIPSAQLEKKVADYLRKSQLAADQRGSPITARELQAEMERMASHTKQPDVLGELFAALGNDPFVIAECLARPILAERLLAKREGGSAAPRTMAAKAEGQEFLIASRLDLSSCKGLLDPPSMSTEAQRDNAAYKLPEISVPLDCTDDSWTATTTANAPDAREGHTAVWTGSEMIVWGGFNVPSGEVNTGGRYNPSTDSWAATSITNAPTGRMDHTTIWTGSEMIVWGGVSGPNIFNTGGRYNPTTDTWTATSTTNAPSARLLHTAVWTGTEMIVWGGSDFNNQLNTGGRYNPSTDNWTVTSITNAPSARQGHTAVWTGSEMIVWGGANNPVGNLNTGGKYNPTNDSWAATSTTNAPSGRELQTAVWTGSEMIVWGGYFYVNTGGRYNPGTDSWIATNISNAPAARFDHTAVWTGNEMIIWGGANDMRNFNTGGRYNPSTDGWRATSTTNAPDGRAQHTAVWSGSQMIIWGGDTSSDYLNTGGRYCAQPSAPIVQSAVSRKTHGSPGSFDIALPLNGTAGIECRTGGATNDYTLVITFLANVSVNGNPQAAVTSGMGMVGTGGVSNGGMVTTAGNVVTIPLTNVANVQTINVTLFNVNGSTNVVIPMSVLVGDTNGNGIVNAGDVSQSKSQVGQAVTTSNFREDVNANGTISATDVAIVKSDVGTSLPP